MRDGFPDAVAVGLGLAFALALSLLFVIAFAGAFWRGGIVLTSV